MDRVRELIEEIRIYGIENNVPIMSIDTIDKIHEIIKENNIKSILELGTAIAYSTINFASFDINNITSIERDEKRYNIALNNAKRSKLSNINLIYADALEVEINDKFDLIIIDAAKSQNIKFFEKYKNNLNENGIIIIDNISFHGLVETDKRIESRNVRQMIRKLKNFIEFLDNNNEYSVEYVKVGDTLAICKKK